MKVMAKKNAVANRQGKLVMSGLEFGRRGRNRKIQCITDGPEIPGFDTRFEHQCDNHSFEPPVACKVRNANSHLEKKCSNAALEQRSLPYTFEPLSQVVTKALQFLHHIIYSPFAALV